MRSTWWTCRTGSTSLPAGAANTLFLHVANTQRTMPVTATLQIAGHTIRGGRVFEISADPTIELSYLNSADVMKTVEKPMTADGAWEFPAASVSAVELRSPNRRFARLTAASPVPAAEVARRTCAEVVADHRTHPQVAGFNRAP